MFLFPSWERPVVGNLSDIVGPNWELGPNRSATLTGSVGVMGVWEPKKLAWEGGSQKNGSQKTAGIPLGGLFRLRDERRCPSGYDANGWAMTTWPVRDDGD